MVNELYTIYVCGPWRPSDVKKKASVVLGYDEDERDGVLFRFPDIYWGNVFYKNGIILAVMDYGTKQLL